MPEIAVGLVVSGLVQTGLQVARSNFARPPSSFAPVETGDTSPFFRVDPLAVTPQPGGPQIGIFGHRRVGGRVVLSEKKNTTTYVVLAIAGAPVQAINAIYVDNGLVALDGSGNVVTAPFANGAEYSMKIRLYTGAQTAADAGLVAAFPGWTADHQGRLQTYAIVEINPAVNNAVFDPVYAQGVPDFQFDVLGFKCYDPRDASQSLVNPATWKYSDNCSIVRANYLIHELGAALDTSLVDWSAVASAANTDDELVALAAGGSERRYTCALYWTTDERHESVLERADAACAGRTFLNGRLWTVTTGRFTASPHATITPDDYVGPGVSWSETPALSSLVNGARGKFISPVHDYEPRDFPPYQDSAFLSEDAGEPYWLDLDLSAVTSPAQAQRLAKIALNRARLGAPARVSLNVGFFNVTAGDTVAVTDTLAGFSARTYRVERESFDSEYNVSLEMVHETAAFFAWSTADESPFEAYDPVLGEPGILLEPGGIVFDSDATAATRVSVRVVPSPSADAGRYRARIDYTLPGGTAVDDNTINTAIPPSTQISFVLQAGTTFREISIRAENAGGDKVSAWVPLISTNLLDTSINGLSESVSTLFALPQGRTPVLVSSAGGSARVKFFGHTADKVDRIDILFGTTPSPTGLTLVSTLSNADVTQLLTATPGTVRFYFMRYRNFATGKVGSVGRPVLVVF